MATRFLHKGLPLEQSPYSNVAPFAVDENGELKINRGAENKGALASDPGAERIPVNRVALVTSTAVTLTKADSGAYLIANTSASVTFTLPATAAGLEYTVAVGVLTSSGGHAVAPQAADKIVGYGLNPGDGTSITCSAATDAIGDFVHLIGDGVDGWFILGARGTWA